ncbi:MAG: PAS domain S-box protein [Candidatus Methylomirabilis oxygeniifera]|uniref:histidine kinase n=1 Tax=Methylomirabilis oxygeniifera TaxID=671143 RepID=D5MGD8_METO1|nr:MAG: PAS domain S-box protein [Candidatus Methylomirabilis oxyfera]CBE68819.1 putative Sensor protein [Candidatus Methylomirabilis oxyfera]
MSNVSVGSDLSSDALPVLIHGAFQGFTGAAERLEQAYAALREQVATLNFALNDTNLRLTQSLKENTRIRHYLSNLLKSIEKGIVVVDAAGRITLWSGGAERLTGFLAAEVSGEQADRLLGREAAALLHGVTGDGREGAREGRIMRKDGYVLDAEISASPIYDESGRVLDTIVIFDDISQRKWVEERRRRSTAQAGLEQMAVTIAHGIRNPLTSIELLATILSEEAGSDVRQTHLAQGIQAGVASVNIILINLLAFTRPVKPCLRPLDLHEVIEEALGTAWYALKERQIDLIREYESGLLEVDGDRELVIQVFLNLVLNAVQAMPSGGQLRISSSDCASRLRLSNGDSETVAGRRPEAGGMSGGEFVEVRVSDSGCGIAEADLEKIFLPFFTTKPKGAGLGLAIVERILERHGARVSLDSRVGQGTTFTLLFRHRRRDTASSQGEI